MGTTNTMRLSSRFLALSAVVLLGGCAGPAVKPAQDRESAAVSEPPVEETMTLPRVRLTGPVLNDILLGEIAGRRGEFGVSVRALSRAAMATRDPRLAKRATLAGLYSGRYGDTLECARLWAELQPESVDAKDALAAVLLELGKVDEAQVQLEKIIEYGDTHKELGKAYLRVAGTLSRYAKNPKAVAIMQHLMARHAQSAEAQIALAHIAIRGQDLSTASAAIDRALLLRPGWEDAAIIKGRILVQENDGAGAATFYRQFLSHNPHATRVRMFYARHLVDRKDWDGAREQFSLVLKDRPEDRDVLFALGLLSLQTDRLDDAGHYLKKVVAVNPDDSQALLYLGRVAERKKNYPQALKWYSQVSSGRYAFEASVRYAVVTAKEGKLQDARGLLHGIIPENNDQRAELALAEEQILREAKRYREALDVLNAALKRLPEHQDLLYARALVAEKLDDLTLHERDLRLLLKLDPENANAMNALGYTLADRTDRKQEAYKLIKHALALRPNDPFILDSMGWVHYRLGNLQDAVRYLRRALKLRADAEISAHLGEVLWVSGEHSKARRVWKRALEQAPGNETLLRVIKKFNP
jgi:tetratricopeptide (TPR) repeat protein